VVNAAELGELGFDGEERRRLHSRLRSWYGASFLSTEFIVIASRSTSHCLVNWVFGMGLSIVPLRSPDLHRCSNLSCMACG